MNRLVQWFRRRASSLRTEASFKESGKTVRTVETVEFQERTILIGQLQAGASDVCPLCGRALGSNPDEPVRPQLRD
jgi:hypothetical protein